jgi:hypothetical protein
VTFRVLIALVAATALLAVPIALAAPPAARISPAQRVDMKVLLLSADGTEPGFGAWQAELDREGVPYDTFVAYSGQTRRATLTDATLADYATDHARYQAVILASGDLGHNVTNPGGSVSYLSALSDAEWSALAKFERTFGIRQLSDYTAPAPAHGLNVVGGAAQDGVVATLTDTGKLAFPYLKGPVQIANDDPVAAETFGYPATPVNGADWQTLLAAPNGTAFLGIYTHPDDGRQEMVMTVASNQFQNQNQLLRHGMLNWVTRGVFLGYQRNYLELQVDDLFLGDDAWVPAQHETSFDPAQASRMTAADVNQAIAWSRAHGLRLDMVFNGGGSEQYAADNGSDPLAAAFRNTSVRSAFGYVNHTYDHANIDCSTASFVTREITDNVAWANRHSLPITASEVVTGEHSGLANARPGNPGTIDPPTLDDVLPGAGGAIPAGTYDYAVTAHSAAGETTGSETDGIAVAANGSAAVSFNAICHATGYDVYRRPSGGAWARVAHLDRSPTAPTDDGRNPITLTVTDAAATGTAAAPPAANGAALAPYGQNPNFLSGVTAAGVTDVASDASKGYPSVPTDITSPPLAAGASFFEGGVQAVPRYPSNVYYNASRQGQQLDEYNWIYVDPAHGGGCVPIENVTTCRTAPATWAEYVGSENRIMFGHVVGNDPRPHFFHQSNLADYNPALPEIDPTQGGILYPVIDGLLARYEAAIDRAQAPLLQPTHTQAGQILAQQAAWAATRAGGQLTAWLQDGQVFVRNNGTAAVNVPLTGTTAGDAYGGQRSGWVSVAAGATAQFAPADPAPGAAPTVSGTARAGQTLTAGPGGWNGTAPISFAYQWQRCDAACTSIPGATDVTYTAADADVGHKLRVVVFAGNWISAVSQAASAQTAAVDRAAAAKPPASGGTPSTGQAKKPHAKKKAPRLALTRVRMSPKRFHVSHKRKQRGTRLDGSRISWRLNRAATVRLRVQRHARHRWVTVGTIKRSAKKGTGVVRFRGRFGRHLLKPRAYRLTAMASAHGRHSAPRRVHFRVIR